MLDQLSEELLKVEGGMLGLPLYEGFKDADLGLNLCRLEGKQVSGEEASEVLSKTLRVCITVEFSWILGLHDV